MQKNKLIYLALFILGITLSLCVAFSNVNNIIRWFNIDDGFFYFKVARNAANGFGFTFDGINRTNGFHPLWMAVCIAVFSIVKSDLILPLRIFIIIAGVLNGLSVIYLFRILSRILSHWIAITLAVLWAVIPSIAKITTMQGMETGLSLFLLLLLIERAQKWFLQDTRPTYSQLFLFGLVAALALLARLDNLFYVVPICLFAFFKWSFKNHLLVFDLLAITLAAVLSWLIDLKFGLNDFSDYTVFPLLFIGLLVIPLVLFTLRSYQTLKYSSNIDLLKDLGFILAAVLLLVPILYAINALDIAIRFPKLVIILMVFFSILFIGINHVVHGLSVRGLIIEKKPPQVFWKYFFQALVMGTPLVILFGGYLTFNFLYAGTLMPVSGKIKHFWSTLANPVYGKARNFLDVFALGERVNPLRIETTWLQKMANQLLEIIGVKGEIYSVVLLFILMALLVGGTIYFLKEAHANSLSKMNRLFFPALFIGSLMRVAYYSGWGYLGIRNWYWVVESLILLIFGGILIDAIADIVKHVKPWRIVYICFLWIIIGSNLVNAIILDIKHFPKIAAGLSGTEELDFIKVLEEATPPGSIIGMTGGGMQGYFTTDRIIVNLDGFINSQEYYQSMINNTTTRFLENMKLDYVYGNSYMLFESDPYREIFTGRLDLVKKLYGTEDSYLYKFH